MRSIVACFFLVAVALPCHAQGDKPKPNTLTPEEIANGWILLFDGETTIGWKVSSSSAKKDLVASAGALDVSGLGKCEIMITCSFVEFELQFEYKSRTDDAGIMLGRTATFNGDIAGGGMGLKKKLEWTSCVVHVADGDKLINGWRQYKKGLWTGLTTVSFTQGEQGANLQLRNIKLRPLNTKSIFNGQDLTGWKEFPGKKSKFAVIDSAINVKDGPGDLQTVGKYKDFVLQLDCISNGKNLNSGIFFRCRDNEYQNGYEAQIRNEFTEKATQKYQIEEYDPKTNKLLGKKEQLFTAVDFGTGAIYRRQPARKQMSKDGEWFTMTIVAHGNHLATWVNGVQVTDWYDHRPKSDNARTGCKLEAGHISIQGHDPTTNLSFKNFRIAELK